MGVGRRYSGQIEEAKSHAFEHALFTTAAIIALLNTGPQVDFGPGDWVQSAKIIFRLEIVISRDRDFPHVFTHGIAPDASSRTVRNVIKDFAIHNQGAGILVFLALGLFPPGSVFDRTSLSQQVI